MAVAFVDVQLAAGATAFQLFDSWAGTLSAADYERSCCPTRGACSPSWPSATRTCPASTSASVATTSSSRWPLPAPEVIGLDWRTSITRRSQAPRRGVAIQGNLDPALVLAGTEVALAGAEAVLADNGGQPGHIFNLGHGVHPSSDPGVLAAIVEHVHGRRLATSMTAPAWC